MALMVSCAPVWAKDGLYVGMDLGVAIAPEMDAKTGGLDDWVSDPDQAHLAIRCDVTQFPINRFPRPAECADNPTVWGPMDESFDGGRGILAGLSVGYRMGNIRAEGEYFYRGATHDSTDVPYDPATNYDPGRDEGFRTVMDGVDDVSSHNIFANIYYDIRSGSKFTPYLGIGVGFGNVSVAYRTLWHRTTDAEIIKRNFRLRDTDDHGLTAAQRDEIVNEISGTITTDSARLSDVLFGYQALAGVDYQVSEPITIGLKFRWADYGEFEDDSAYDLLRNHESVAGNPPMPVTYYVKTDDIQFWSVSLNMKYQF